MRNSAANPKLGGIQARDETLWN